MTFIQDGSRIRATGELTGLTPGRHGLQVQEKGDCNPADAEKHGAGGTGDLGTITASASGSATVNTTLSGISIASLMGKGLALEKSDASGNSTARVACGVVK